MSTSTPVLPTSSLPAPPTIHGELQAGFGHFANAGSILARKETFAPRFVKDLFELDDDKLMEMYDHMVYVVLKNKDNGETSFDLWDNTADCIVDDIRTRAELEETHEIQISEIRLYEDQKETAVEISRLWDNIPDYSSLPTMKRALVSIGIKLVEWENALRKHSLDSFESDIAKITMILYTAGATTSMVLDLVNAILLEDKSYAYLTSPYLPQAIILFRQLFFNKTPSSWRAFRAWWENYGAKLGTQIATVVATNDPGFRGSFKYNAIAFSTRATMSVLSTYTGPTARFLERYAVKQLASLRMESLAHGRWCDQVDEAAKNAHKGAKLFSLIMAKFPPGRPSRRNLNPDNARDFELSNTLQLFGIDPPRQAKDADKVEKGEAIFLAGFIGSLGIATAFKGGYARLNASFTAFDMVSQIVLDWGLRGVSAKHALEKVTQRVVYISFFQMSNNIAQAAFGREVLSDNKVLFTMMGISHLAMWTYGDLVSKPVTSALVWTLEGGLNLPEKVIRNIKALSEASEAVQAIEDEEVDGDAT